MTEDIAIFATPSPPPLLGVSLLFMVWEAAATECFQPCDASLGPECPFRTHLLPQGQAHSCRL